MFFSTFRRLKFIYVSPPQDNFIFKLCYRWTTSLLLVFFLIITCRLLVGYSFVCISADRTLDKLFVNLQCYDNTVYTLPTKLIIQKNASAVIDPLFEDFRRYQSYYPWVNLVFLVHAFNFYLPHLLWKSYEKGYMCRLTAGVQKFFDKEEKRGLELCHLAKYVLVTKGKHKHYMTMYIFFEACNFVISLAQTLWLVNFFDVTGVPDFLPYILETWTEFKNFYFPSSGLCELQYLGASGSSVIRRMLCQLPLNSLYMKMFLFLYAWYIFLTVLCGMVLIYRIALLFSEFRLRVAKNSSPMSDSSVLLSVYQRLSYSDWFFVSALQNAMTNVDFALMLDKIAAVSKSKDQHNDDNVRFSFNEHIAKDLDSSSATSPL